MGQSYGLGRGLSSLIPKKKQNSGDETVKVSPFAPSDFVHQNKKTSASENDSVRKNDNAPQDIQEFQQVVEEVDLNKIVSNPYQPRSEFDENKLKELAQSIQEHGIIQPLIVAKVGESYELVAGERRWRAAQIAGLKKVPVIVRDTLKDEKEKLELAVIENIQRHNLNPIEEAKAYEKLIKFFKLSQEEVAQKMGRSRSTIANKLRLLSLPIEAQKALKDDLITEGHAKAILSLDNPEKQRALLELILKKHLTVRQAENQTRQVLIGAHSRVIKPNPELVELAHKIGSNLGTKVTIKQAEKGGKIVIDYYSEEELKGIIDKIL